MNKNVGIAIAVIVAAVLVVWYFVATNESPTFEPELEEQLQNTGESETNTLESNSESDTTTAIESDLSEIDYGDFDQDFSEVDAEINSL